MTTQKQLAEHKILSFLTQNNQATTAEIKKFVLTNTELVSSGMISVALNDLVSSNKIKRIIRGVYQIQ